MDNNLTKEKKEEINIDLSSISNINAVKGTNPSVDSFVSKSINDSPKETKVKEKISEGYNIEKFEKYPRKFEFVQPSRVKLPSNGLPYKNCEDKDIREGYALVYPLTMKEEEILSTQKYINEGVATIMVVNNCLKSNIDAVDLVVSDFYYLLMYLRQISISDNFDFNIKCPHCGNEFRYTIKISEQKFKELDPNTFKEPIRIDLPTTDYTVLFGLPRIKTIRDISSLIDKNEKDLNIGVADLLFTRTIAIISPNGDEVPKEDWIIFYNNLPHKDSEVILKYAQFDNGMNHIINNTTCPKCGKEIEGSAVDLNTDSLFRYEQGESEYNQE